MGGGSYSYDSASARCFTYCSAAATDTSYMDKYVFTERSLNRDMDVKNKIRESRDSDEHPKSFPIIIGLDVTGSMGYIPKELIKNGFPEIMKKIMDNGVEHAQVCFMGIGDSECDRAPIQVGQFETSDELTEKWLKSIYLEGGGGGNEGESYALAWYVAGRMTSTDSFEKRGKKGVLITIGDEPYLKTLRKKDAKELFGGAEKDVDSLQLLDEARKSWDVYHINVVDYSGIQPRVQNQWKQTLGDHLINTESRDGKDIPDIIAGIILKAYKESSDASDILVDSAEAVHVPTPSTPHNAEETPDSCGGIIL